MAGGEPAGGHRHAWAVGKVRRAEAREEPAVDQVPERLGEEAGSGPAEVAWRTPRTLEPAPAKAAEQGTGSAQPSRPDADEGEAAARTAGPDRGRSTVSGNTFNGPTASVIGDNGVQNNYFALALPDPVELGAQRLGHVVLAQWRQEAALRGLLGPDPIPVRWRATSGAELADHVERTGRPGGASTADLASFADVFSLPKRRRLVVLGEPGSGKSSLAVLLVIELLQRMVAGDPVPVLLPLASWRPAEEHLTGWLERQLLREYPYLDRGTVRELLARNRVLPVLDGLDEMPAAERPNALRALNTAMAAGIALILTCRTEDYRTAVRSSSVLREAAVVEADPLTAEEAAQYVLRSATPQQQERWRPLADALREDPSCPAAEVLRVPLMLWLCRTAYGPRPDGLPGELADRCRFPDAAAIESHLLDSLVPSVYPVGPQPPPQPGRRVSREALWEGRRADPQRVSHWLGFLARHLERRGMPDLAWWELGNAVRLGPRMAVTGLVCAVFVGLLVGPLDGVRAALAYSGPEPGLRPRLVHGIVIGVADILINAVPAAVAFAIAHGVDFAFKGGAVEPSRVRIRLGRGARRPGARSCSEILARAGLGIAGGLAGGLGIGLLQGIARKFLWDDPYALRVGLVDAVAYGCVFAVVGGPVGAVMAWCEAPEVIESAPGPRELLARSRKAVLLQSLLFAPLFGVGVAVAGWLAVKLLDGYLWGVRLDWTIPGGLRFGLLTAFGVGLGSMLSLTAWGQWMVFACLWLPLTGRLPRTAMAFLEDAHRRGVLRKAGAVYQFRHTRLQQHFARPAVRLQRREKPSRR
ncbi:NACHT domain-containing protein [Kitasatospora griseola]|uniref:NACHT domain-containing protein n=1 Tax=Kitasatospora griseola TaxID=2064 RepID=UPI003440DDB2